MANNRDSLIQLMLQERDAENNAVQSRGGKFGNLLGLMAQVAANNANPRSSLGNILGGAGRTYINTAQAMNHNDFLKEISQIHATNFIPNGAGQLMPLDPQQKLSMIMSTLSKYGQDPSDYKDILDVYSKQIANNTQVPLIGVNSSGQQINMGMVPKGAKMVSQQTMGMQLPQNFQALAPDATPQDREAWLNTIAQADPITAENVKGLADYSLDPSKIASYRGNQRAQFAALAKMYNPAFNMAKYGQRQKFLQNLSNTNSGSMGGNILSLNTLIGHLQLLQSQAAMLSNGQLQPVNAIINFAQELSGNPNITNFEQAKSVVDSELERALTGVGATQGGLRAREQLLSSKASPQQMIGAINVLQDIMATRLKNLTGQYKSIMGKDPAPGEIVYKDNQDFVDKMLNQVSSGSGQGSSKAIFAVNPQTKVRIKSVDGGKTWQQA